MDLTNGELSQVNLVQEFSPRWSWGIVPITSSNYFISNVALMRLKWISEVYLAVPYEAPVCCCMSWETDWNVVGFRRSGGYCNINATIQHKVEQEVLYGQVVRWSTWVWEGRRVKRHRDRPQPTPRHHHHQPDWWQANTIPIPIPIQLPIPIPIPIALPIQISIPIPIPIYMYHRNPPPGITSTSLIDGRLIPFQYQYQYQYQ